MTTAHVLQFFKYDHLPPHLQEISKPYAELAEKEHQRINAHVARKRAEQAPAPAAALPAPPPAVASKPSRKKPRVVVTPPPEVDNDEGGEDAGQAVGGE